MSTATPSDPPLRAVVAHGHQRIVPVDKCLLLFWIGLRLRSTRHQIVQAHLSSDYEVAFDVMLYCMWPRGAGSPLRGATQPLDISLKPAMVMGSKDVLKETVAATVLEEVKNALRLDWLERKAPEDFEAMCALSAEKKQVLFAWCTAYALNQQLSTDNGAGPVFEQIGRRMRWSPRGAHNVAVTRAAVLDGRLSVSNAKNAA